MFNGSCMISLPPVVFSRWLMGHTCEPIKVGAERKIKRGTEWTVLCIVACGRLRCVFHYVHLNAKPCDRLCLHQHIVPPCLGLLGSDQQECLLYSDVHVAAVALQLYKKAADIVIRHFNIISVSLPVKLVSCFVNVFMTFDLFFL